MQEQLPNRGHGGLKLDVMTSESNAFAGRRIAIVGASRNIGAATAVALALRGARLLLVARSDDSLRDVVRTCAASGRDGHVETLAVDLAQEEAVETLARVIELGAWDSMVYNAYSHGATLETALIALERSQWNAPVAVNLLAPIRLGQAIARSAMEHGVSGSIVNVLSTAAFSAGPERICAYGVTKAALWSASQYMAMAWAPHVRVNAIVPGPVSEDGSLMFESWRQILPRIPMARIGTAAEAAEAAVFLLSPGAGFTTAQAIFVDGGRVASHGVTSST